MRTLLDGVFLSRPVLWVPVWGFCVFGYARALGDTVVVRRMSCTGTLGWRGWLEVVLFSSAVGCVYVVNQWADRNADRRNAGFAPIAHAGVSGRTVWITAMVLGCAPFAGAMLLHSVELACLAAAALVLGVLYSLRPARLSGRPAADFLSNAVGYSVVAFGLGWSLGNGSWTTSFVRAATPYFLLMCAGSISSTIPDMEGDRSDGKRTTAVALGARRAHILATLFVIAGGVAALAAGDWRAVFCGVAALPFYVAHLFVRREVTMEASYKVGGAAAMLAAATVEPPLVVAGLTVFAATRWYFRMRFGVSYPTLVPLRHA